MAYSVLVQSSASGLPRKQRSTGQSRDTKYGVTRRQLGLAGLSGLIGVLSSAGASNGRGVNEIFAEQLASQFRSLDGARLGAVLFAALSLSALETC